MYSFPSGLRNKYEFYMMTMSLYIHNLNITYRYQIEPNDKRKIVDNYWSHTYIKNSILTQMSFGS